MVNACFVLINQASDRPDVDAFLPKLRDALDEDINQRFALFHGGRYGFRVATSPTDRLTGEVAVNVRHKQDADPAGALAWHQVTGGVPDIELPFDLMSGLTGDSDALDVCANHEIKETILDPGANLLADNRNGKVSMKEACDRVEDETYPTSNGLNASNFLLKEAWVPGAPGPYDYMQVLTSQLDAQNNVTMTSGGYDIEGTSPSDLADVEPGFLSKEHVVSGDSVDTDVHALSLKPISGLRLARKQDRFSRAYRCGLRL